VANPLNALYDAVGWIVKELYGFLSPVFGASSGWTWALTIVILVVFMRLLMVPLFIKQMHTTRAMTSLQPQMAALRKRYKGDKQTLNQETMKLYQEAGINPLMGCLPVVAQLPLFFALFSVLRAIAEWKPGLAPKYGLTTTMMESASHAKILGASIADKFLFSHGVPVHAKAVILLAVVVSMVTTYLTVRQSMKRGMMPAATPDNPMGQSQKYMAYILPFFALTGLYWPFGLVLYWVTTNLWTLGQQWVLFKRYPYTPPSAAATAPATASALAPKGISAAPRGAGAKTPAPRTAGARTAAPKTAGARTAGARTAEPKTVAPRTAAPRTAGAKPVAAKADAPNADAPKADRPKADGPKAKASSPNGSAPPAANGAGTASAGQGRAGSNGSGRTQTGSAAGDAQANGTSGGMLRRLGRGRAEPEPQPEESEVKLVRQQRQRQSRSKRSGKR
jgi:YidC/Oxa1 family membrane protein insertase